MSDNRKSFLVSLLKRNFFVVLGSIIFLSGLAFAGLFYVTSILYVGIGFLVALFWANFPLIKSGRPKLGVLLSLILLPVLGFPVWIGSVRLGLKSIEKEYAAQGFTMKNGCNGGAANEAYFQVVELESRLKHTPDTSDAILLQKAYALAQEKRELLNEDCRRRGHRENFPLENQLGDPQRNDFGPD